MIREFREFILKQRGKLKWKLNIRGVLGRIDLFKNKGRLNIE